MTKEQIINQVEPNGELLTTDMAIAAMDIWGLQQAIQFARYLDSVDASPRANDKWFVPKKIAPLNIADYNSQFIPTEELYNKFLEQK